MPKQLIASAPNVAELVDYQDGPVPAESVRVACQFGAPKHGTEMTMFHGGRVGELAFAKFPFGLGNMCVGQISAIGEGVEDYQVGDRVAGYGNLRPTHTWKASSLWRMPERMSWQEAVCFDPAQFTLAGIRDGHLRLGDNVAVSGLGAIGQMAVQMCKLAGARWVAAIDPLPKRCALAAKTGADLVLNPMGDDVPQTLLDATDGRGVDLVIETSANYVALDTALRGLAYGGTIAYVGWAKACKGGLDFGGPAHFNVPNIIFARACSEPNRDHPRWSFQRIMDTCWEALAAGQMACDEIIYPIVDFDDVVEAYLDIDRHPETSIKLGVRF